MTYDVFRLIDSKPGCVDYLGSIKAKNMADAERIAETRWTVDAGERLDIQECDVSENGIP